MQTEFTISTRGPGLYEMTREVKGWVSGFNLSTALLTLYCRHTSCSLLIQENADPDVRRDLNTFFERLVPPADHPTQSWIIHTAEGPDDLPAHIKAALTPVSLSIPISEGQVMLGTWQGIYVFEHRQAPHHRRIVAHISQSG